MSAEIFESGLHFTLDGLYGVLRVSLYLVQTAADHKKSESAAIAMPRESGQAE